MNGISRGEVLKSYAHKVPGGKLIKIKLELTENRIQSIVITGDFFLHPEDCLLSIEESLVGCEIDSNLLVERIENIMSEKGCQLIGATASDLVIAIMKAAES